MKKQFVISCLFLALCCCVLSCGRTLETEPLERHTNDFIFDNKDSIGSYAMRFLANVYYALPNGYNRIDDPGNKTGDLLATMTDDAIPSNSTGSASRVATGGYTPLFNPDDDWTAMYAGIRSATIFYNNIDVVPLKDIPSRHYWKAEARFIRAFLYFQLLERYGGVPLLGDSVRGIDDDLEIPRSSFSDCVTYIVGECDACAPLLRKDPVAGNAFGHAGQGAAMALKARVLLYAASPLNNPDNDLNRWKQAADAAKAVMDLGVFHLLTDFASVFTTMPNSEVIFSQRTGNAHDVEKANGPVGYTSAGGIGLTSPTQELVDAFDMKNGLPITDPGSGYQPEDPYTGRDPRFYQTILYNGAQWLGRPVETFEGGADRPGTSIVQTRTGYYLRKFMGAFENTSVYADHPCDFIYFRYGEILLDYAEALNEYSGPSEPVYAQLIAIRARAGIDPGSNGMYGLKPAMTQDEMRQIIHHERRVELAFEEQRFWDLRRWKIAAEVYAKPLHGVQVSVYQATGEASYKPQEVLQPFFKDPEMYRYPIQYNTLIKNEQLVQNPGWQ